MAISENDIKAALAHIIDPDLNQDIVSLGFVRNIEVKGTEVRLDIALTTPACPVKEQFKQEAERSLLKLDGVEEVVVNMTSQARPNRTAEQEEDGLQNIGAIIAISSCKGGVGKSTLAAHMAREVARRGYAVGLMDADVYGPSVPTLFQIPQANVRVTDQRHFLPVEKDGLKLMSFGFLLKDAPAVMRGPLVTRYIQQMLLKTDWGQLDYLFIDMPPGTGDVHITIAQTARLNGAVIVTTPHTLSIQDVARGILMFEKVQIPVLGVIENMSYFQTDPDAKKHYLFGQQGEQTLQRRFGIQTLAEIPVLPPLSQGTPGTAEQRYIAEATDQTIRALGKQQIEGRHVPSIKFNSHSIHLQWKDGKEQTVGNRDLRLHSQDALSVNELTGERRIKPEDIRADIAPVKIIPLGNYAIGIEWNDGHSAGIYPYTLIDRITTS